jgi:hypothetical protein
MTSTTLFLGYSHELRNTQCGFFRTSAVYWTYVELPFNVHLLRVAVHASTSRVIYWREASLTFFTNVFLW